MEDRKKILVVEDEGMIRRALCDKLEEEHFEAVPAVNGKEGLEKAISERPGMILLDVVMPEMDGITMSQKLEEHEETKNIPVMFLTNLSDSQEVRDRITKHDYEFLVKANWDISDVVKKIKEKIG
ncbi:MAG TPA: response regulator [Candidatus Paceibacterota bacterium]|nr:response regulator [Candidatus Paceibacterota bacterium]